MIAVCDRFVNLCSGAIFAVLHVLVFAQISLTVDAAERRFTRTEVNSPNSGQDNMADAGVKKIPIPDVSENPISIPDVYESRILARSKSTTRKQSISIADVHRVFKNEPRDEKWAAIMESGLKHYLVVSGSGKWAVVEYLECRTKICEVAGYTIGTGIQPRELVKDFTMRSDLWKGDPIIQSIQFNYDGTKRFIVLISGYSAAELQSFLSSP